MRLSVAYTFEPGLIPRLAAFAEVKEVYGKLDRDIIGGGRSTYTLRPTSTGSLKASISAAHRHSIAFNYLVNGAALDGSEQTRLGQRRIRRFLEYLDGIGVDAVTVASPLLLKIVKHVHPRLKARVSAFACIDSADKARQWEDLGADTLCLSAIGCNRDRAALTAIRACVACDLQLIVNANCIPHCAHELTHMNLLTQSSRKGHHNRGFCLDYCFLHCSLARLKDPELYLRSVWIRPEDLRLYEEIGIDHFKIVERSCASDLLVKRVQAYATRRFDGNLMELVAPVAQVKKELEPSRGQYLRMVRTMAKPWHANLASLLSIKRYAQRSVLHDFSPQQAGVYMDNRALDGFLEGLWGRQCRDTDCRACGYCASWAERVVRVNEAYRRELVPMGEQLDRGLRDGSHWR
jgi:collagenase-like PrtC family protease